MRICFVGLGSIGLRHLRNICALLTSRGTDFRIDALRSSSRPLPEDASKLLHRQYTNIADLPTDYDIAFICSPTAQHRADIERMLPHARHMFVEKPIFDRSLELDELQLRKDGQYYVACPLRYNAVLQYVKGFVEKERIFSARAICSTYLPAWRPGVDYRSVYSAHREMGGGVSIDLIHEWDYLCYLFGFPTAVESFCGTYSNLEVDSDDLALYIAKYPDKLVSLYLDYFGRYERREIELYTENETLVGDIRHAKVTFLREGRVIDLAEDRDAYQRRELEHFLDIISGKATNDSNLSHGLKVLKIAKGE